MDKLKRTLDKQLQGELDSILSELNHLTNGFALKKLSSTNDYALHLEKMETISGTIVMASEQLSGRGRCGRSWHMQKGDIALSIILRPPWLPKTWSILPMIPALAIIDALVALNINAKLKWPNDIVIAAETLLPYCGNFRKLGGILVENVFRSGEMVASIIGIGINIIPNEKLKSTIPHMISLKEKAPFIDRFYCLKNVLYFLDQQIAQIALPDHDNLVLARYIAHCETLGKNVVINMPNSIISGRATHIKPDGSLIINDGNKEHAIFAGDVMLT